MNFEQWLLDAGYQNMKPIGNNRYAAICKFMFTTAIVVGKIDDTVSLLDRWCYSSYDEAKQALDDWDGTGEPTGWHRHPASGRRIAKDHNEYDQDGVLQMMGALYVMW